MVDHGRSNKNLQQFSHYNTVPPEVPPCRAPGEWCCEPGLAAAVLRPELHSQSLGQRRQGRQGTHSARLEAINELQRAALHNSLQTRRVGTATKLVFSNLHHSTSICQPVWVSFSHMGVPIIDASQLIVCSPCNIKDYKVIAGGFKTTMKKAINRSIVAIVQRCFGTITIVYSYCSLLIPILVDKDQLLSTILNQYKPSSESITNN